jgi:alkanesulfonate monooxygenase SsuD/methylene tetrahydromethanopterin reductase-like flavin-dependent oxidoreductase (luciferase family)
MTSTVDTISGGRLIVGLGVGDRMSLEELHSYGYTFPILQDRITLLRETIMTLKAMWSGNEVSLNGRMVKVSHASCVPKPKQEPGPRIWVAGRHRKMLDVAAELADGWNHWGLTKRKLFEREAYLRAMCARTHRNRDAITESWAGTLTTLPPRGLSLLESMRSELMLRNGNETNYFIASLPATADRKAYESFAEAVRSLG